MKLRGTGNWGNHLLVSLYLLMGETPRKATWCLVLDSMLLGRYVCP